MRRGGGSDFAKANNGHTRSSPITPTFTATISCYCQFPRLLFGQKAGVLFVSHGGSSIDDIRRQQQQQKQQQPQQAAANSRSTSGSLGARQQAKEKRKEERKEEGGEGDER